MADIKHTSSGAAQMAPFTFPLVLTALHPNDYLCDPLFTHSLIRLDPRL